MNTAIPTRSDSALIHIDIARQRLTLTRNGQLVREYPVSTGAKGHGCEAGSYQTPIGLHRIKVKVGKDMPIGTVFKRRRPTGEIHSPSLYAMEPERDWILSRILWLDGLEPGRNRRGTTDTLRRYIYIHGTPDDGMTSPPSSHGCIRMYNDHIIELFDDVSAGTIVLIEAGNMCRSPNVHSPQTMAAGCQFTRFGLPERD